MTNIYCTISESTGANLVLLIQTSTRSQSQSIVLWISWPPNSPLFNARKNHSVLKCRQYIMTDFFVLFQTVLEYASAYNGAKKECFGFVFLQKPKKCSRNQATSGNNSNFALATWRIN